jgi:hypothetical protein
MHALSYQLLALQYRDKAPELHAKSTLDQSMPGKSILDENMSRTGQGEGREVCAASLIEGDRFDKIILSRYKALPSSG